MRLLKVGLFLVLLPLVVVVLLLVGPLIDVVWGVRQLGSNASRPHRRPVRGAAAILGSLALAGFIWPVAIAGAIGSDSPGQASPSQPAAVAAAVSPSSATNTLTTTEPIAETTAEQNGAPAAVNTSATGTPMTSSSSNPTSSAPERTGITAVPVVGVSDGDTIKVRVGGQTERVRLIGIDTPELSSADCYAQQAASKMQSMVQGRSVLLAADPTQDDRDRYDRLLRHVSLPDGTLVAQTLIQGGFGREYTYDAAYQHRSAYVLSEQAAIAAGRGLWGNCPGGEGGSPDAPQASASEKAPRPAPERTTTQTPQTVAGSCNIKGNISSSGEKIYHLPGGRSYAATKISHGKGERWFCSETDAADAGWRAARG